MVLVKRVKLREKGLDVVLVQYLQLCEHADDELELVEAVAVLVERRDQVLREKSGVRARPA